MRSVFVACFAISALVATLAIGSSEANAVVYCKTVGFPKGCVARPAVRPPVVVYCKRVGYPKGCVAR
jgi:hypothetical protein